MAKNSSEVLDMAKHKEEYKDLDRAIDKAIRECISEGILANGYNGGHKGVDEL